MCNLMVCFCIWVEALKNPQKNQNKKVKFWLNALDDAGAHLIQSLHYRRRNVWEWFHSHWRDCVHVTTYQDGCVTKPASGLWCEDNKGRKKKTKKKLRVTRLWMSKRGVSRREALYYTWNMHDREWSGAQNGVGSLVSSVGGGSEAQMKSLENAEKCCAGGFGANAGQQVWEIIFIIIIIIIFYFTLLQLNFDNCGAPLGVAGFQFCSYLIILHFCL